MRSDELYLRDILDAATAVRTFLADTDRKSFEDSDLIRSAVLQKLLIVGEAAARVSDTVQSRNPHIPWKLVSGFRNIAVHTYFNIRWDIVWSIASNDLPALEKQVEELVRELFSDDMENRHS